MSSGVSIDTSPPSPPSQQDEIFKLAYAGSAKFMERIQALFDTMAQAEAAKSRSEDALAALNLGTDAKSAFAEADRKRSEATAMCGQADELLKQARSDAADIEKAAKAKAAGILADAQKVHDGVTAVKANHDAALAAAIEDRKALAAEREAARRLGEEAERARAMFEYRTDCIRIVIDEFSKDGTAEDMGARIRARQAALKQPLAS
jgi:flotillin